MGNTLNGTLPGGALECYDPEFKLVTLPRLPILVNGTHYELFSADSK